MQTKTHTLARLAFGAGLSLIVLACGDDNGSSPHCDCSQIPDEEVSSSSGWAGAYSSSSHVSHFNPDIEYGELHDSRDGQTYRTVVIGSQTWMAENLNYETENGSWCYEDTPAGMSSPLSGTQGCDLYGRLYDWNTATTVCPSGWHLPSDAEWDILAEAVGGSLTAGTKLKAKTGWFSNNYYIAGTDDYGFSALPGGGRDYSDSDFSDAGYGGIWWSSTETSGSRADSWVLSGSSERLRQDAENKVHAFSVRCVKD
jgi:uncharacterized protein (TIGR02145 family)